MKSRLIFPFLARLHQLDTLTTASTDPDGVGPLTSGFDDDFKESVLVDTDSDGVGEAVRDERPPVLVTCQVEPDTMAKLQVFASGASPESAFELVFHFSDLTRLGLVDPTTGDAMIRLGDRLSAILSVEEEPMASFPDPPGMFVTEARPIGFGLNRRRPRRNLLLVSFDSRDQASRLQR